MTRRKFTTAALSVFFCMILLGVSRSAVHAQCTTCDNSYLNVTDWKTIDYDNMVSTFHSSIARQADGRVLVWGEHSKSNGSGNNLVPAELNSTNYSAITGQILKFAAGSYSQDNVQFAVITTNGLFIWGDEDALVSSSFKSGTNFSQVANGLPVPPLQVKMLFGTYRTLALLTCSGDVWVLSQSNNMRGNGGSGNSSTWAQVEYSTATGSNSNTSAGYLSNIVAVRGAPGGLMALDENGEIWAWGDQVYLGTSSSGNNLNVGNGTRSRARKLTLTKPQGGGNIVPKMIGMTGATGWSSQYVLGTDGYVYSMGNNDDRQLGDRTTTDRTSWVRVKTGSGSNDFLSDIAWISPNEHDNYGRAAVNALTSTGVVWAWGNNERNMLGFSNASSNYHPATPPGGLSGSDLIMAVETGGHTSMVVKKCSGRYGYVGHRVHGSMADNSNANEEEKTYNFSATAVMDICGASSGAAILFPPQGNIQVGDQIQLVFTPAGGQFTVLEGAATVTQSGLLTINGKNAAIKVSYTANSGCGTTTSEIVIAADDISLPASFDQLSAAISNGQLRVNFTTLTEHNNSHFEIEGAANATDFVKIGELKSKAANGDSNVPLSYIFTQNQRDAASLLGISIAVLGFAALLLSRRNKWMLMLAAVLGTGMFGISSCSKQDAPSIDPGSKIYIRVKQVDKDGAFSYSKVIQAVQE